MKKITVLEMDKQLIAQVCLHVKYPMIVMLIDYIRCFIVVRAIITATPFIWVRNVVAYLDVLTRSLGSRHQEVTGM